MPWIYRSRSSPKAHECRLPPLTKGAIGQGYRELASPMDEWACRWCGTIWQVDRIIAVPPGFKGEKVNLKSTYLGWSRVSGRVWG